MQLDFVTQGKTHSCNFTRFTGLSMDKKIPVRRLMQMQLTHPLLSVIMASQLIPQYKQCSVSHLLLEYLCQNFCYQRIR